MFDTAFGLPAHPLLVHLPVVLLPLSALVVAILTFRRAWRPTFAWPALVLLALGAGGAVASKLSGDALARSVGIPSEHERYGAMLVLGACVYLVVAGAWLLWVRRPESPPRRQDLAGIAVTAVAVAVTVLTVLTGHSGAKAVWGSGAPTPAPSTSQAAGITLDEVRQHATASSCWASIDGTVYDLTTWIPQHPGGAERIEQLCGTDATAAFERQHQGQARPAAELERLALGPLVG